jgi:hypothetical protein
MQHGYLGVPEKGVSHTRLRAPPHLPALVTWLTRQQGSGAANAFISRVLRARRAHYRRWPAAANAFAAGPLKHARLVSRAHDAVTWPVVSAVASAAHACSWWGLLMALLLLLELAARCCRGLGALAAANF